MLIQLIIVQVITFVAIVFVLRKLLYSESAKETLRLKRLKEEASMKQKELQRQIDEAQNAYKVKMAEAEEERRSYRAKSEEEIEVLRKKIMTKAKDDAESIVRSALNAKEKMREEVAEEMRKAAPAIASRIFKETLSQDVREMVHKELVKGVIDKIRGADKASFKSKIDRAEAVSAFPLSKNDKLEIESAVRLSLGYDVSLHEKRDGELVAGILIKLGTILIDGTLDNRLKQMERQLGG